MEKEFDFLRARGGDTVTKAYDKGKAEAFKEILGVADNFERAAGAISAETDGERAVVAYYKDVYDTMMGCLESLGLTEVETVGVVKPTCTLFCCYEVEIIGHVRRVVDGGPVTYLLLRICFVWHLFVW